MFDISQKHNDFSSWRRSLHFLLQQLRWKGCWHEFAVRNAEPNTYYKHVFLNKHTINMLTSFLGQKEQFVNVVMMTTMIFLNIQKNTNMCS